MERLTSYEATIKFQNQVIDTKVIDTRHFNHGGKGEAKAKRDIMKLYKEHLPNLDIDPRFIHLPNWKWIAGKLTRKDHMNDLELTLTAIWEKI